MHTSYRRLLYTIPASVLIYIYACTGADSEADVIQFVRVITEDFISNTLSFKIECTGNERSIAQCAQQGTSQYECNGIEDQLQLVCIGLLK